MIRISAEPSGNTWGDWKAKAQAATDEMISRHARAENIEIDERLYKEQRLVLLGAFHNKCGYCEVLITAADHLGDIEHYRPKGRVTDEQGNLVLLNNGQQHPGYFWLAYRWDNLFPACIACNRPGAGPDGVKSGKWDCFPVLGFRAERPGEESREHPILLSPRFDDPYDHIVFNDELGIISGKTDRGSETIRKLGLNRDGLVELRKKAIRAAKLEFLESQHAFQRADDQRYRESRDTIRRCLSGQSEFSAVCKEAIILEKTKAELFLNSI
jgi:hypothetical protein